MKKTICPVCKKKIPMNNEVCPKCFSPLKIEILAPDYKEKKEKEEISSPEARKKGEYIGHYKIVKIFSGGMGRVYICSDDENRFFALKTFKEELFSSKEIKDSFIKEAHAWIDLGFHSNIVACFSPWDDAGQLFLVLEYITPHRLYGNTLTDYLRIDLKVEASLNFAIQFCHGMEHAISRGIVCHRDIKPDNIMITKEAIVKITDFGLVKVLEKIEYDKKFKKSQNKTIKNLGFFAINEEKTIVGTPPWMASEQFEGKADVRSDIYSFGVVLYQMVNQGKLPFFAQSIEGFYLAHKTFEIPKSEPLLYPVIEKCLQKDPNKRYQNFKDLRKDLETIYNREFGEWSFTPRAREDNAFMINEYLNRGKTYIQTRMYDRAIIEFKKALEFEEHPLLTVGVYLYLGHAYKHKKMFQEALNWSKKALQIKPDFGPVRYALGNLYRDMGDLDRAIQEYKRALSDKPNDIRARFNLAGVLENKGLFQEAVYELKELLKIEPHHTQIYFKLGFLYLLLEQVDEARESYHEFVTNPPPNMHEQVKAAVNRLKTIENDDDATKTIKDLQKKYKK